MIRSSMLLLLALLSSSWLLACTHVTAASVPITAPHPPPTPPTKLGYWVGRSVDGGGIGLARSTSNSDTESKMRVRESPRAHTEHESANIALAREAARALRLPSFFCDRHAEAKRVLPATVKKR
jgi:hypothetical protein